MSIKLNYQTYGEGEPVLILHGLFGSGSNWKTIAKQLADKFKVLIVDLRNHGNSDHADSMSYKEMADDVSNLFDTIGLDKANIISHSMGGKTAMVLALNYPSLIKRLLIVDIAPVDYTSDYHPLIAALDSLPLDKLTNLNEASELLRESIPEHGLRQFLLQNLVRDSVGFRWRINLPVIKSYLKEIISFPQDITINPFQGPVRFLAGSNSDYIQSEHHDKIDKLFPKATIHSVKDAGHWLHVDQPAEFLRETVSFLSS